MACAFPLSPDPHIISVRKWLTCVVYCGTGGGVFTTDLCCVGQVVEFLIQTCVVYCGTGGGVFTTDLCCVGQVVEFLIQTCVVYCGTGGGVFNTDLCFVLWDRWWSF